MECPPSYIDKWVTSVSSRFTAITTRDQDVYATSYGPNNAVMLYTINRANTSPPTTSTVISPFLPANTYMYPVGVAVYNNYVYVVVSCHQILRCKLLESAWAVFSGSTTGLSGNTNSRGTQSRFNNPTACCVMGDVLYVADASGTVIRAVSLLNSTVTNAAGRAGAVFVDGASGAFQGITSMCADFNGRLWVTDGNCVRRVDVSSGGSYVVTTIAGDVSAGYVDARGNWPAVWNRVARFNAPRGIVAINEGYETGLNRPGSPPLNFVLYVSDTNNAVVRRIDAFSNVTTLYRVAKPTALTVDKYGRSVYVCNEINISKLTVRLCGTTCVDDFSVSAAHCGGCAGSDGVQCQLNMKCRNSSCACEKPATFCPGTGCVVLGVGGTDKLNCGACGKQCKGDDVCKDGKCVSACKGDAISCNHICTNIKTDTANCGGCAATGENKPCKANEVCKDGACTCLDPAKLCASPGGGSVCTDVKTDAQHCGACGNVCGPDKMCYNGACVCDIYRGFRSCNPSNPSVCSNVATDSAHCGLCTISCASDKMCQNRVCVPKPSPCVIM